MHYAVGGNGNSSVDVADYTVWANGFATPEPSYDDGDFNCNGEVDAADYTIWANNFGVSVAAPASAAAAVPEPSTFVLAAVGMIGLSYLPSPQTPLVHQDVPRLTARMAWQGFPLVCLRNPCDARRPENGPFLRLA